MYLVTIEDETGAWFDDPHGFDSLREAEKFINSLKVKGAAGYALYSCNQIEYRELAKEQKF